MYLFHNAYTYPTYVPILCLCLISPKWMFIMMQTFGTDGMDWIVAKNIKVDAIDSSTPAGRERLKKIVATLLNSYLAQLLESGFLHADPHP